MKQIISTHFHFHNVDQTPGTSVISKEKLLSFIKYEPNEIPPGF